MTLGDKIYPKTVRLKKTPAIIGGVFLALIVFFLGKYMLMNGQLPKTSVEGVNKEVTHLASKADTNWTEEEKIKKAPRPTAEVPLEVKRMALKETPVVDPMNDQKAMQAPLGTNQLNFTLPDRVSSHSITQAANADANPSDLSSSLADNQQEKRDFIKKTQAAVDPAYLSSSLDNPISQFEVKAGTVIPGVMITGINSELPGQLIAQVRTRVFDTVSGNYLLIPQGTKMIGTYDSQVAYGQSRVLVVWQRLIFPNGQSFNLQGMPGADLEGYSGFHDQVNNHYIRTFGSAILMSLITAGVQLSQPQQQSDNNGQLSVNQIMAQNLGISLSETSNLMLQKNLNIQPTLVIRPGYRFNITVTSDMIFPHPYTDQMELRHV